MLNREEGWDSQEVVLSENGRFTLHGVPQGERLGLYLRLPGYHVSADTPTPGFDQSRGAIFLTVPPNTRSQSVTFTMAGD
jgi:hypothetical protein